MPTVTVINETHPNGKPKKRTTTTTRNDGSVKEETVEDLDPDGKPVKTNKVEKRKDGSTSKETVEEYDPPGTLKKKRTTEKKKNGDKTSEEVEEHEGGRLRKKTTTTYGSGDKKKKEVVLDWDDQGQPKGKKDTTFDGQGRPKSSEEVTAGPAGTTTIETKYKDGVKRKEKKEEPTPNTRPPEKVVTETEFCKEPPDRIRVEVKQVWIKPERTWQKKGKPTVKKFDCKTGTQISMGFGDSPLDYASVGLLAVGIVVLVMNPDASGTTTWGAAAVFVLACLAAIWGGIGKVRDCQVETADALSTDIDIDIDEEMQEVEPTEPIEGDEQVEAQG